MDWKLASLVFETRVLLWGRVSSRPLLQLLLGTWMRPPQVGVSWATVMSPTHPFNPKGYCRDDVKRRNREFLLYVQTKQLLPGLLVLESPCWEDHRSQVCTTYFDKIRCSISPGKPAHTCAPWAASGRGLQGCWAGSRHHEGLRWSGCTAAAALDMAWHSSPEERRSCLNKVKTKHETQIKGNLRPRSTTHYLDGCCPLLSSSL